MTEVIEIPRIIPKGVQSEFIQKREPENPKEKVMSKKSMKLNKKAIIIIAVFFSVVFFILILIGILSYSVYKNALDVQTSVNNLVSAANSQNLPLIKGELAKTKNSIATLKKSYKTISWLKITPYFGRFVSDVEHAITASSLGVEAAEIVVDVIEPYADIIGFVPDGEEAESAEETTQDRLDFLIKTIPDIIPKADLLSEKVSQIKTEMDSIDPSRYPEKVGDYQVRFKVTSAIELVDLGAEFVTSGKPLLAAAPYILGNEEERTYLVIFQNDKELRPTGGFITAYSIAKVEKGKFEPVSSNDIYNLDNLYTATVPAPEPIIKYLKGPYLISKKLRLRDMNWSPDFSKSMEQFVDETEKVGIEGIDGVIAVDTQLLVNILEVLGPIGVSGFGNFSTQIIPVCNCPQVIYELESFADVEGPIVWSQDEPDKIIFAPANIDNRKKIIGPLMNSVLANALGQPKDKLPALFNAVFKSLTEKHVLFYMMDDVSQNAVNEFGIAGTLDNTYQHDYLHINDANLGGRKSNLYVTQEVAQEITVAKDGSVEKTLTLTYKNPEKHDGWLNSVLPNYVRIYVPKGSELISFDGVEDKYEPYEEFGKTVFPGFFQLRPEGITKVTVVYRLPFKVEGNEYKMLIQKQPGTDAPLYTISLGKHEEEIFLRTDKEFKFKL